MRRDRGRFAGEVCAAPVPPFATPGVAYTAEGVSAANEISPNGDLHARTSACAARAASQKRRGPTLALRTPPLHAPLGDDSLFLCARHHGAFSMEGRDKKPPTAATSSPAESATARPPRGH